MLIFFSYKYGQTLRSLTSDNSYMQSKKDRREHVRWRRALFCRKAFTGDSCLLVGFPSPRRSHPVRAEISFPAQSFAPRLKFRLEPVLHLCVPPVCIFFFFVFFFVGETSWQRCTITHAI